MHEGRGDQHAGAEMSGEEQELVRYGESRESFRDDGERASWQ